MLLKKRKLFPNTKEQIPLYHFHLTCFFLFFSHSLLPSLYTHGCASTRAVCPRRSSTDEARHFPTLIIPESNHNLLWVKKRNRNSSFLRSGLVAARGASARCQVGDPYWSRSPCTAMCACLSSVFPIGACVRARNNVEIGIEREGETEWKRGRARNASPSIDK